MNSRSCRHCGSTLEVTVIDLGSTPLANDYVDPASELEQDSYELHARLCTTCNLVQVCDAVTPERLFSDYAYFSSYSQTWLEHARRFSDEMISRLGLGEGDLVAEVASNDGYLLRNFAESGLDVLGIEPAANVAQVAIDLGIDTRVEFFGEKVALALREEGVSPRLVVANNVFAHVPDINDFAAGLATLAGEDGVVSLEFPHLAEMVSRTEFDTIYHEHFSYLSLAATENVLGAADLAVFDVHRLPTHGGSLRVLAGPEGRHHVTEAVERTRRYEDRCGLTQAATYAGFQSRAERVRKDLLEFLGRAIDEGATVAGYGAAAKGNTLLNFCGVTSDQIPMVADANPHKQGLLLPGSRIPITSPDELLALRPDYVLILPWNLCDEIQTQLAAVRSWGGRFVTAVPNLTIGQ
ncbi:MAG: methyltransferase domain-containing protein [Acidimicrobiales bacterium]